MFKTGSLRRPNFRRPVGPQLKPGVMLNNEMSGVIFTIQGLVGVFKPHCRDCSTLTELAEIAADRTRWRTGKQLFERIREKTLKAERMGDRVLEAQCLFEEECAKTLFNLSTRLGGFDADCPFNIVPEAFALARYLNIPDSEIVRIIAS